MSESRDPFAPSSDPDIPTPARADLLKFVNTKHRDGLAAGSLPSEVAETLWVGARAQWDERHKAAAKRRGEQSGKGTRVPGQISYSSSEYDRKQREQEKIEAEVVETMLPTHRAKYNNPDTPEDQRNVIFQTYKDKLEERKYREAAEFRRRVARIAEAQDLLRTIKDDPQKAHIPRPADDSEEELLKWHEDMQRPADHVPFPVEVQNIPLSINDNLRKLQEIPLQLQDDVQKMGDAVGSPNEKVSWIHRIPVWKELGRWLKLASACFGFALGMTQVNEYAWAMLGLIGCGVCCLAQIYAWTASPNRFKNWAAKMLLAFLSLVLITIAGFTVVRIKGKKAWSNLSEQDEQMTRVPQPIPQEKPDLVLGLTCVDSTVVPPMIVVTFYNKKRVLADRLRYAVSIGNVQAFARGFSKEVPNLKSRIDLPYETLEKIGEAAFIRIDSFSNPDQYIDPQGKFELGPIDWRPQFLKALRRGDPIVGAITLTCANCERSRGYWIFFRAGVGGWFAETADGSEPAFDILMRGIRDKSEKEKQDFYANPEPYLAAMPILEKQSICLR